MYIYEEVQLLREVDFPSDDNEWMLSNDFQKAKQLWISSNNNPENKDYKKASCLYLNIFMEHLINQKWLISLQQVQRLMRMVGLMSF